MHPERRLRLSKFLSLILRHRPEQVGLTLDGQGRVAVAALVDALRANGWEDLQEAEIAAVVRQDPRRFEIEEGLIRARYGHSVTLEQPGSAARPPEWLYYAVADAELEAVRAGGLRPEGRRHVHLCQTPSEASRLLERRAVTGQVVTVLARRAQDRGIPFYQATEHLYLTTRIPPDFTLLPMPVILAGAR
jgi:putative RNA 2'-phosphotransferase